MIELQKYAIDGFTSMLYDLFDEIVTDAFVTDFLQNDKEISKLTKALEYDDFVTVFAIFTTFFYVDCDFSVFEENYDQIKQTTEELLRRCI